MAELNYHSRNYGAVTLRSGYDNGRITMEVWFENKVIAKFGVEYLWDFMEEVFQDNPPKDVLGSRGQTKNYLDFGSRYYCMQAASQLRNVLSINNPSLDEVMEKIRQLSVGK